MRGDLWLPETDREQDAAIVLCHGFKGFKDWGFFPYVAETLADRLRVAVVSFNFSGSGVGADLESFDDPEGFGHNTFTRELDDLGGILDGLADGRLGSLQFDAPGRFGVLGHSRGAVSAILAGERSSVGAVVTWAGVAHVQRYVAIFDDVPDGEAVTVTNARTGDVLPLYDDVKRDILDHPGKFDVVASLRRSRVPTLVVHGTEDPTVPLDDARLLASAGPDVRLVEVTGAGHTFEVGHPFSGPSPQLNVALEHTVEQFQAHLLRKGP